MNRGPEDLFPRLLEACPFRVVEASLGERHGDTDGRVIRVNRDLLPGEKAATLLHGQGREMAISAGGSISSN